MVKSVKVFKKTAPNGNITVYLGRRDFVDNTKVTEPIDGVVVVDDGYLGGRKLFATVKVTYRFGREEDEVMGVKFSKEFRLLTKKIYPDELPNNLTEVQEKLIKKLGPNAHPFQIDLGENAPVSVQIQTEGETAKPLGVIYDMRIFAADKDTERPHRRNSVGLAVRKVQYSPQERGTKLPSTLVSKGFALSSGKLSLEMTLDKDIYYHGEQIAATLQVTNGSKKTVRHMKCSVIQHVELTMTNTHFTREITHLESKEGCPITPGTNLAKTFYVTPGLINRNKGGVALDGKFKDVDVNLASSTLTNIHNDSLGIIVSYSVRVKLNCGSLGGELVTDIPFKLLHPNPYLEKMDESTNASKTGSRALSREESVVVEEFAKFRRGVSVDVN